jgi:hypothetical protein
MRQLGYNATRQSKQHLPPTCLWLNSIPKDQEKPMTSERDREIKRRRHRRDKVRKLRARLERTTDVRQRAAVIRRIQRVSPTAPVPES